MWTIKINRYPALLVAAALILFGTFYCGPPPEKAQEPAKTPGGAGVLVSVKDLQYEQFEHFFLANGSVEAVTEAYISPEINGQVKQIHVEEGDMAPKGTILVTLNSSVIESSMAEVETDLQLATIIYEKRKGLWEKKIGSEVQFLESKTNKESLENKLKTLKAQKAMTRIRAPIEGIVDQLPLKEGELAAPGQLVVHMICLDNVYVNVDISEAYVAKIQKGDPVIVSFPAYPELEIATTVHYVGNVIKAENRTFKVQLLLDNRDQRLKPNMIAVITLKDLSVEQALIVPSIIIKNDIKGAYLYVTGDKDGVPVAKKTYITPGMSEGSLTMVTEGLEPGQQVIVEGYNLVKNGMKIRMKSNDGKTG